MQGQWLGVLKGETPGNVVLDLEERSNRFTGTALFTPTDPSIPATGALIDTGEKLNECTISSDIFAIHPSERVPIPHNELKIHFPDILHDQKAQISLSKTGDDLSVSFRTSVSSAEGVMKKFDPHAFSMYPVESLLTWDDFKKKIYDYEFEKHCWRGQSQPWSLATSFHRTGRCDLYRYTNEDINTLRNFLLPHTTSFLQIQDTLVTGALYNLAQHHGFPTPILDWTHSPFVAAFFAFRSPPTEDNEDGIVRIMAFDHGSWSKSAQRNTPISFMQPHITFMELPPVENKRSLPQQAVAMVTNLHNIEMYIYHQEHITQKKYLHFFDIILEDRNKALRDLRTMGITASSLFPGIDGVCEELKHRLFDSCR